MKSIVRALVVCGLLAGANLARGQDQIPWAADFRQACEQADRERRLVLLHFYSDDCPPCVQVEQNVFSRPDVAQAIARNYVPVKIHAGQNPELAARYQITKWPTDVAVTPAGLEIHRSTSPQLPEHYIELVDLMALKAGTGTSRQWAANMQQVGQATLDQAAGAAQGVSNQAQQQWNQGAQQFQMAADQARNTSQQRSQQAQDSARQYSQQTQTAVQQYQQQAQGTVQQWNQQAANTAQGFQQQTQAAGQQIQNTTQQFGDSARQAVTQWQSGPASGGDLRAPFNAGVAAAAAPQPQAGIPPGSSYPLPAQQSSTANPFFGAPSPQQPAQQAFQPQQQATQQFVAASQAPPISLEGYCPVTLVEAKKWKKADPQFGAVHRGRTYLFANADQQKKFLANPDAFAPILSGYDPVRFTTTGQLVEGKRAHGLITPGDNRIFLFADEAALEQFKQSPRTYAEPAYQAMMRSETAPSYR